MQQAQSQSEQSYIPLARRVTAEASVTAQIVKYNYLRPAWYRTKPWLAWTANQCGAAAAFTLEKTCDYAPVVADGVRRGSASACRKTKRAADATHAMWSDYWYGGASHPEVSATQHARSQKGTEQKKDTPDSNDEDDFSGRISAESDEHWRLPYDEEGHEENILLAQQRRVTKAEVEEGKSEKCKEKEEEEDDDEEDSDDVQMVTIEH